MRKVVFTLHTGYCGMDAHEFYEVSSETTDSELDDLGWQLAVENAERYGIYPTSHMSEDEEEWDGTDSDSYSDNIDGSWEDYIPEEHDRHRIGNQIYWNRY